MATADQDAVQLLVSDHREVEGLFKKFEAASGAARKQSLVEEICTALKMHSLIEEEIFYPGLEGKIDEDALKEAYVEHDAAKLLINDLMAAEPDEEFYDTKVHVLKEEMEHHIYEEERKSDAMFHQARKTDADLDALGKRMQSRKQALMQQAETEGLPPAQTTAIDSDAALPAGH